MESEHEIAAPGFAAEHPDLFHYTDLSGLRGIFESNNLWATHFSQLNDSTEVMLLRQWITPRLASRVKPDAPKAPEAGNRHARRAAAKIPIPTERTCELDIFVDSMFRVAFEGFVNETNGIKVEPLGDPYVTSFCRHSPDSYEGSNGLLSQWRAYGGAERYCIVFDTQKLLDLLTCERNYHYWTYLCLTDILYATDDISIDTLCPDLQNAAEQSYYRFRKNLPLNFSSDGVLALLSTAPRFKHQGFQEEQEVRIIAIPGKQSTVDMMRLERPEHKVAPLKTICSRPGKTENCKYIALFDCLEATLPIKRIVVGPSKTQDKNLAEARRLTKNKFPLISSATPFIG